MLSHKYIKDRLRRIEGMQDFFAEFCVETWDDKYEKVAYLTEHPKVNTVEYRWCDSQRRAYVNNNLTKEQIAKMEMLSWWFWSKLDRSIRVLEKLSTRPSRGTKEYRTWMQLQRCYRKTKGEGNNYRSVGILSDEEIKEIEDRVPWWEWKKQTLHTHDFDEMVKRAKKETKKPPCRSELGMWCNNALRSYEKGRLGTKQKKALESIPWLWKKQRTIDYWIERWQSTTAKPIKGVNADNHNDYSMVLYYRERVRKGLVAAEDIKKFEAISWWSEFGWAEFSEEDIKQAVRNHVERTKFRPTAASGPCEELGVNWGGVDSWLRYKHGYGLSQFTREIFPKLPKNDGKQLLTADLVWLWVKNFIRIHGEPPKNVDERDVPDQPSENWKNINAAFRYGNRGLAGGSSLAKFIKQRTRLINVAR